LIPTQKKRPAMLMALPRPRPSPRRASIQTRETTWAQGTAPNMAL
jgi:hypothetical protein